MDRKTIFLSLFFLLPSTIWTLPVTNGLVAHYQAEGNVNDSTGSHHGTNFGASFVASRDGLGQALQLDGGSYVNLGHSSDFQILDTMTVSGWFRTSAGGSRQMIIQKGDQNAGGFEWVIEVRPSGEMSVHFEVGDSGSTVFSRNSDQAVNDGEFHHFAAVFFTDPDAENIRLFVDGQEQATISADLRSSRNYGTNNVPMTIGARNPLSSPTHFFSGAIDDIAVCNRDLSESEINSLFSTTNTTNAVAVPEPGSIALLSMALACFVWLKKDRG